jgi:alpha-N-arabinofuranosidase
MEDALTFGGAVISLLNHADRVRAACLAQLVNVIAPILTETGGGAWRQTIFFPFAHMSNFGRGTVLRAIVDTDSYKAAYSDPRGTVENIIPIAAVPYLKLSAVHNEDGGITLFALNRDLEGELRIEADIRGFKAFSLREAVTLNDKDLKATNTKEAPERIKPSALAGVEVAGGAVRATLPRASWNVIRLKAAV